MNNKEMENKMENKMNVIVTVPQAEPDKLTSQELLLLEDMKQVLNTARNNAARAVNREMLDAYWNMGRILHEYQQSLDMETASFYEMFPVEPENTEKVLSRLNLIDMRDFYLRKQNEWPLTSQLSWAHHLELLRMGNAEEHRFYTEVAQKESWTVEELKSRRRKFMFLEHDGVTQEQMQEATGRNMEAYEPADSLHEADVLDFLGLPDIRSLLVQKEREMQQELRRKEQYDKLIQHIKKTVLGFEQGFEFAGFRQRVPFQTGHCDVDVVFYNKILRSYVLVMVKCGKLKREHAEQMDTCLDYYAEKVNADGDNLPVGILIHKEKDCVSEVHLQPENDAQVLDKLLSMLDGMSLMTHLRPVLQECEWQCAENEEERCR